MVIAIDAMGGDFAPREIVSGAIAAAQTLEAQICLVGDEAQINPLLDEIQSTYPTIRTPAGRVIVRHSEGIVGMDESPLSVLQRGRKSSIAECVAMIREGEAQAAVSAGNSGAFMALATMRLKCIADLSRPAIAIFLPTNKGKAILLDAGANADCKPEHLLQFAMMGSCYAEHVLEIQSPNIALLNIGEENCKGNILTQAAYPLLEAAPIHFIGNVEGNAILDGHVDVIVADGFAGNIVLKVLEGAVQYLLDGVKRGIDNSLMAKVGALLMRPSFAPLLAQWNWVECGGGLLLGVNGVCVVSHGRSDKKAICKAIEVAANAVDHNIIEQMRHSFRQLSATFTQ